MFIWLALPHLPPIPQHFVNRALEIVKNLEGDDEVQHYMSKGYDNRKLKLIDGTVCSTLRLKGKRLGDDFDQWVRENIVKDFITAGARIALGDEDTKTHGAHVDSCPLGTEKPIYKFYYLLEDQGNSETVFFKEKGQDLERVATAKNQVAVCDYSQLEEISRIKIPLKQWMLLNTSVLHGVENVVTGQRKHITIIVYHDKVTITAVNPL